MPVLTTLAALTLATAVQTPAPAPPHVEGPVEVRSHVVVLNGAGGEQGMDADKDGFVSRPEFTAPLDGAFSRLDKDGDGKLSKEEMEAGHGPMGQRGPRVMRWSSAEGGQGPNHEGPGGERDAHVFTLNGAVAHDGLGLDADNDGRVTEDEFLARPREAFRRMDKDGSGALEAGERGPGGSEVRIVTRQIETRGGDHAH